MKSIQKTVTVFFKKYFIYILAISALILPDIQLRALSDTALYDEFFSTRIPAIFNAAWIGAIMLLVLTVLPSRTGKIVYIITASIFTAFSFVQYIYFGIFDQFFRIGSIGLAGEGGNYITYALGYADLWCVACTLCAILFIIIVGLQWHQPKIPCKIIRFAILIPVLTLVGTHLYMSPELFDEAEDRWDAWCNPRIVYSQFTDANKCFDIVGIYHFAARDIFKTYSANNQYNQQDFDIANEFFDEKKNLKTANEYTNVFEGKNVIAVMMESIDDWMITEKYTPVIKYMMGNGINFASHYAPTFGAGFTLGSEYCFNTGFYTPESAQNVTKYTSNKYPYALPQLFKNKGYSTNSFHYNYPDFYNRVLLHHSLGYEKYHSFLDYGLQIDEAHSDSNILKHDDIYTDIVSNEPFFSFIITYSGHIPYTFDDAKLLQAKQNHPELADDAMDYEEYSCRILARDTDDFFRMLLQRLYDDGLLDNTVIVGFTDHYAYGFSDAEKLRILNKEAGDGSNYRVPAFIYCHGAQPTTITKTTQTADLMPTMINLFGLEDTCAYVGNDALDPNYTGLAYFSNYGWKNENLFYAPDITEITEQNKQIIDQGNEVVEKLVKINDIVIDGDYFANNKQED